MSLRLLSSAVLSALVVSVAVGETMGGRGPLINTVDPPALIIGKQTTIQLVGRNLDRATHLLLPFAAKVRRSSGSVESTQFVVTVPESVDTGVYPVRVYGPGGLSNLRLICVGRDQVIQTRAAGNGRYRGGRIDLASALAVEWPCRVAGGRLSQDIDLFRFSVRAGQRLVFSTQTRQLGLTPDPVIRLRDARGRTLALAHDTPTLRKDERLDYTFQKAGEYFVELQSFGVAGWTNHYVLKIGPHEYARTVYPLGGRRGEVVDVAVVGRDGQVASRKVRVPSDTARDRWRLPLPDHPGSLSWAMASGSLPERHEKRMRGDGAVEIPVTEWPVTINGRIEEVGEEDRFRLAVQPGQVIRAQVAAWYLGSALDGLLMAWDPVSETLLATGDDLRYRANVDPGLEFTVPPGVTSVVLSLRDTLGRGGVTFPYRLTIEPGGPDFFLWLGRRQNPFENSGWERMDSNDTVTIARGGQVSVRITARRNIKGRKPDDGYYKGPVRGFDGNIRLVASGLPVGVTAESDGIASGETAGEITFRATAGAVTLSPFEVAVFGEATRRDGTRLRRVAERMLFLSDPQMTHMPWQWRSQKLVGVVVPREDGR